MHDPSYMHSLQLQTSNKSGYMATELYSACVQQMKRRIVMHLCKAPERSGESNNERAKLNKRVIGGFIVY